VAFRTVHAIPGLGRRTGTRPETAGGGSRRTGDRTRQVKYTHVINDLIEQFTYLGIFAALFLGGVGVPVPEEMPVLAAGALAHAGYMRAWIALPICLLGVLSGDAVLYWAGHHWGERILEWPLVRRVLTREREGVFLEAYRRHLAKTIFTARHVMGLRAAAFLTAGIARVPFWKFILLDAAAASIGVPVSFGLAYFFTDQLTQILHDVHRIERWLLLLGLMMLAAWLAWMEWRKTRRVDRRPPDGVL
jgi:membrane protein DedA with SNARE-associated domain